MSSGLQSGSDSMEIRGQKSILIHRSDLLEIKELQSVTLVDIENFSFSEDVDLAAVARIKSIKNCKVNQEPIDPLAKLAIQELMLTS